MRLTTLGKNGMFLLVAWFITLASLLAAIYLLRDVKAVENKALQVVPKAQQSATSGGFAVPPPPW